MSDSPGKRLKAGRESRGLAISDITTETKMRPSMIEALEADDFSVFPSITHARNFLLLYGKFLNVDVKDGIAGLALPSKIGVENYQYLNVEHRVETSHRLPRRSISSLRGGEQGQRNLGIIFGAIAFLFCAVYLGINLQRLNLASASSSADSSAEKAGPTPVEGELVEKIDPQFQRPSPTPEPSYLPFHAPSLESRQIVGPTPRPRF